MLELEYDSVIIGAGLAGLTAAFRLKSKTLVVSKSLGATAISTGTITYDKERDLEAEKWFIDTMRGSCCEYITGKCVTDMGKECHGMIQESTAYPDNATIISLNGLIDKNKTGFKQDVVDIRYLPGRSYQEISGILENDQESLKELGLILSGIKGNSLALPPMLGCRNAGKIRERLEAATGKEIYEYTSAPSVMGLRLIEGLREKLAGSKNVDIMDMARIERVTDGTIYGHIGTKARREITIAADRVVLATGGLLTGFAISEDRLIEPLTGTIVSDSVDLDFNEEFLSDHPIMNKGIGSAPKIRGFKKVTAAGAVSSGYGLYNALVTGYHAGDSL